MVGLYVINSLEGGGAERVFSQLIDLSVSDDKRVHSIEVALLDKREIKYPLPEAITVHQIDVGSGKFSLIWAFLKLIKMVRPTYVVSFLTRANNLNILGNLFFDYSAIISERSNTNGRLGTGFSKHLKRLIVKVLYRRAACVIAVSEGVKNCLVEDYAIPDEKVEILNNPYNLEKIQSLGRSGSLEQKKPIVAMGRLTTSKRFDNLIHAYAKSRLECGVQILGQGEELNNLKKLAVNLGVETQVEFLGFQDNPYQYIHRSLFFVLSSKLEGFPNALVEAMVLGKAVIATDCTDGPREILKLTQEIEQSEYVSTENGIMVRVDDIDALAKAMRYLAESSEVRQSFERQSIRRADDFNSASFYQNFKTILQKQLIIGA